MLWDEMPVHACPDQLPVSPQADTPGDTFLPLECAVITLYARRGVVQRRHWCAAQVARHAGIAHDAEEVGRIVLCNGTQYTALGLQSGKYGKDGVQVEHGVAPLLMFSIKVYKCYPPKGFAG